MNPNYPTTETEARLVVAGDLLLDAYHKIKFLHECLVGKAQYSYPEMTLTTLKELGEFLDVQNVKYCAHSYLDDNCEACQSYLDSRQKLDRAKRILAENGESPVDYRSPKDCLE